MESADLHVQLVGIADEACLKKGVIVGGDAVRRVETANGSQEGSGHNGGLMRWKVTVAKPGPLLVLITPVGSYRHGAVNADDFCASVEPRSTASRGRGFCGGKYCWPSELISGIEKVDEPTACQREATVHCGVDALGRHVLELNSFAAGMHS